MVTLMLVPMLGIVSLVTDIGWAYFQQRAAQAAADAAALGAVRVAVLDSGGSVSCGADSVVCSSSYTCPSPLPSPTTSNLQDGCYFAKDNGFAVTAGGSQNVVMSSGTQANAPNGLNVVYWATASVTESVPQGFSRVLGYKTLSVSAVSTAGVLRGGGGACVSILDPTGISVTFSGSAGIHSSCGIDIKSNNADSVLWSGSPSITATGGAGVFMAGGCLPNCGIISPSPTEVAQSAITDPLASLPTPTPSSTYQDASGPVVLSGSQTVTLNPGTYEYGITASGGTITMNPGLYILEGGITLSGSTSISGTGVTIYSPSSGITMSGTGSIDITAPTSGTYSGIAFYEGRSNTSGATLSGGSNVNVTGAFYAPDATLTFSGGSNVQALNIGLVVKNVVFSGNTYIEQSALDGLGGGGGGIALIQ
jgi:hypothetical protein